MKQFGLIGFPLGHSFSKKYFTEKFELEKIDARYDLFELPTISEFELLIKKHELSGLNVTIPYKEKVINYLDELDETATKIGAVNVIKFIRQDGKLKLKGYNSDAIGFEHSLKPFLKAYHTKALILGTGGASKAIDYILHKNGIETTFVSRTKKSETLVYSELNKEIITENLVIINASPVGTFPHSAECPDIPYQFLTENHLLFDVVYNPAETLFLKKGKEQGAQAINGEGMLVGQAVAAWEIWNSEKN
ncbi:MAG: shikimate dehydrogenase [Paludibacter sp.]|nr:shikimate dehydrogenase [Paludibacter sp.]